jgi:hypothetical protein
MTTPFSSLPPYHYGAPTVAPHHHPRADHLCHASVPTWVSSHPGNSELLSEILILNLRNLTKIREGG